MKELRKEEKEINEERGKHTWMKIVYFSSVQ
jgi:hypothetical protein